jgi:hypothetical protein
LKEYKAYCQKQTLSKTHIKIAKDWIQKKEGRVIELTRAVKLLSR